MVTGSGNIARIGHCFHSFVRWMTLSSGLDCVFLIEVIKRGIPSIGICSILGKNSITRTFANYRPVLYPKGSRLPLFPSTLRFRLTTIPSSVTITAATRPLLRPPIITLLGFDLLRFDSSSLLPQLARRGSSEKKTPLISHPSINYPLYSSLFNRSFRFILSFSAPQFHCTFHGKGNTR